MAHQRVEVVHESLLRAWPRLVRWQAQDAEGALLRDQLRQAAQLWSERGRRNELLWSGSAVDEYRVWRGRYPGGLTATEEAFADAMLAQAERRRKRLRAAVVTSLLGLGAVVIVVTGLWQSALNQARLAEASKIVALGRVELDRYPTAAVAYARKSLEVADTAAGRRLALEALWRGPTARVLPLGERESWNAEFSPDGRWLASFSFSDEVLLISSEGGPPRVLPGHGTGGSQSWAFFKPDGSALLTWRQSEPRLRFTSVPHGRELGWMAPLLDDDSDRPCGWDRTRRGVVFCVREEHRGDPVLTLQLAPYDGGRVRVAGSLRASSLVGVPSADVTGSRIALVRGADVFVRPLAGPVTTPERRVARVEGRKIRYPFFDPRGESLAIVQRDGQLTLWPLDDGSERPRVLRMAKPDPGFQPVFDGGGTRLAWGSSAEGSVSMWRLDGPPVAEPVTIKATLGMLHYTKSASFHPSGDWLAVAQHDFMTFWATNREQPFVLRGHESPVRGVHFTPDSRWLVSCGFQGDAIRTWPLAPDVGEARVIPQGLCHGLALAPDGQTLLMGTGQRADVIPLSHGESRFLTAPGANAAVAFDASGRTAATAPAYFAGPTGKLRIWDLESPADSPTHELPLAPAGRSGQGYEWGVFQLAFSNYGGILAAGRGGVRRFDLDAPARGAEWIWELDPSWEASMALSRDGRLLLARARPPANDQAQDHPVALFDLVAGTKREIASHGTRVEAVAVDPSGEILVTGDAEGAIRVGRVDGGEPHLLLGHTGPISERVNPLAVSPDGRWIASISGAEIRLWPMPDIGRRPFHLLSLDELLERLGGFTNLELVEAAASPGGYKIETGPFPGWKDVPTW